MFAFEIFHSQLTNVADSSESSTFTVSRKAAQLIGSGINPYGNKESA
jgi:hypothetical protein